MRRSVSILLLWLYGIMSVGIFAQQHFCGGEIADQRFFALSGATCACGMNEPEEDEGCCRDEIKVWQIDDAHQASAAVKVPALTWDFVPTPEYVFVPLPAPAMLPLAATHTPQYAARPPTPPDVPHYIRYCNFRI